MFAVIPFPDISPIAFSFDVRWYALAYVGGLIIGLFYLQRLSTFGGSRHFDKAPISWEQANDLILWATFGIILGGRLAYIIFYQPDHFLNDPIQMLAIWNGGMSFHGGFLGVVVATILFARKHNIELLKLADILACVAPVGLFLGRIANFINGELYGHASDVSWAMVFPNGGPSARHPSQLYEAALEGLLLFIVLGALYRFTSLPKRAGTLTGLFIGGYGCARFFVEFFRQPDTQLGYLWFDATMGQLLSLPMIAVGIAFIVHANRVHANRVHANRRQDG